MARSESLGKPTSSGDASDPRDLRPAAPPVAAPRNRAPVAVASTGKPSCSSIIKMPPGRSAAHSRPSTCSRAGMCISTKRVWMLHVPAWQVSRMQAIAELRGWAPLVALEIPYNLIE